MAKLYNLARVTSATTGTGTITLGSAVAGFLTFADAGVGNGETVTYAIKDGANSEIGRGVYTAAGTTLTRTVLKSTNSNSAINLSGSSQVFISAAAEDFADVPANLADGTAASPALRFSADTDVGIFRQAADTLSLATAGTERVRVSSVGDVCLGAQAPSYSLHAQRSDYTTLGLVSSATDTTTTYCSMTLSHGSGVTYVAVAGYGKGYGGCSSNHSYSFVTNNTDRITISTSGTLRFHAYGSGTLTTDASGNVTATSDERLKEDIQPFAGGLAEIEAIKPISYRWSDETEWDRLNRYGGFSAQNVRAVLPIAVGESEDGYLSVQDRPIIAALVNAVKQLSAKCAALEARVSAMEP